MESWISICTRLAFLKYGSSDVLLRYDSISLQVNRTNRYRIVLSYCNRPDSNCGRSPDALFAQMPRSGHKHARATFTERTPAWKDNKVISGDMDEEGDRRQRTEDRG